VFLGANPHSSAAGIVPEDLPAEGFRLKTAGNDVHIVGRDSQGNPEVVKPWSGTQCGTLYGVYELLERDAGVMFCWHDELGTVVPRHENVVVPPTDTVQAPAWEYRALSYSPEGATYKLFGRRLRLGGAYTVVHRHNWFGICPAETYGETHPEYFALVKGKRQTSYYLGHHGGQVCTSNPEVVDLFAEAACAYFRDHPEQNMFSVSPNDGGGFCECDNCTALDTGDIDPENPDRPVLTDRMLHFYNAIAEKVAAVYPDKLLGAYIYSYYTRPPLREPVHPNLFLVNATNSAHTHGVGWEKEQEMERRWAALSKHFVKYDIYYRSPCSLHLIAPVTTHLIEKIKTEQANGLQGGYLYIGQTYEQLGAGHYLLAKMMWDRNADARALEERYYNALYGPAGPDVLSYYHLLEERLRKMRLEGIDVDDPGIQHLLPQTVGGGSPALILAAYWPVLDRAEALIAQAADRPLDELQRKRLKRLQDQHRFMVATVRGMVAAARLETQSHFNQNDVDMLKQAVDAREQLKATMRDDAPTLLAYLEKADLNETARVSPEGAFYQLTRRNQGESVQAVKCTAPPKIDGLADDPVWRTAQRRYLLLAKSAAAPQLGATARFAWDEKNLYLYVEGREQNPNDLKKSCTGRDDTALFGDDNVEVFVQPPDRPAYYHAGFGAGGALYDAAHPGGEAAVSDASWNSDARSAVHVSEHAWAVEIALPFTAFDAPPGAGWKLNVCRTRRGNAQPDEYTAISPTFGGYHNPERLAELELVNKTDEPAIRYGTLDDVPDDDVIRRLRAGGHGEHDIAIVKDRTYCGPAAARISVAEGGLAQVTFTADVQPETAYRIVFAHLNAVQSLNGKVRPQAPITRIIFRGSDGKAVTDTKGYSWYGADALDRPGAWRTTPHVFTTPPSTAAITFTLFFHHPGQYWLDEVRIEPM
jgi:hypothetical protein